MSRTRPLDIALTTIVALAFLQTSVGAAYAKGSIRSAEHDFSQFTVAILLPVMAVAALAIAIAFRSGEYQREITVANQAASQPVSSSLTILGIILLVGGALLLLVSGIYNEYGQLLLFYDYYWSCMNCEQSYLAPFAALGIMTTASGVFLIAINHRYLSYCIRRIQTLA